MYYKEAGPILDFLRNLFKRKPKPVAPTKQEPETVDQPEAIIPQTEDIVPTPGVAPPITEHEVEKPEVPFAPPETAQPIEEIPVEDYIEFPEIGTDVVSEEEPYAGVVDPFATYYEEEVKGIENFEPPITFNEWVPPTDVTRFIFDTKKDYSLGALLYLKALGYKEATWYLSEAHPKFDICDERAGTTYNIDFLIEHAYLHASGNNPRGKAYNLPSPIFSITHPGCLCYLACLPPMSVNNIPDGAPGLPIYAQEAELYQYKENIFKSLKTIVVDSLTMPPIELHKANQLEASTYIQQRTKVASTWTEVHNPIEINSNFISKLPLGFTRPIFMGYTGVEIGRHKKHSRVYILEMNRVIVIPTKYLTILEMEYNSDIYNIKRGDFIIVDGELSMVYRVMQNKDVFAFMPDFNHIVKVDEWKLLKRKAH